MTTEKLTRRLLGTLAEIHPDKVRTGDFTREERIRWDQAYELYANSQVTMIDATGFNATDVTNSLLEGVANRGIKKAYLDYGQLLKPIRNLGNKENEVSETSKALKEGAKLAKIPLVCLLQMNREVEKRGDKRGKLSDLRESGSWEQDADIVIFLYRPAYYFENLVEHEAMDGVMMPEAGYSELIVRKAREGKLGFAKMKFMGNRFEEYIPADDSWNINRGGYHRGRLDEAKDIKSNETTTAEKKEDGDLPF